MRAVLGVSVGAKEVCAVLRHRDRVLWAGTAPYTDRAELADLLGPLVAETPVPVAAARVVLDRDIVQLRTWMPAPALGSHGSRRWVALEAPRLFRKNGATLVTDAVRVRVRVGRHALIAAAAPESLLEAVVASCRQAGLTIESLGPSAEILPWALAKRPDDGDLIIDGPGGSEILTLAVGEVCRSRCVRRSDASSVELAKPLIAAGDGAMRLAAAYAATLRHPRLELWPPAARRAKRVAVRRRLGITAVAALALWLAAAVIYTARLQSTVRASTRELASIGAALDSASTVRRELAAARAALSTMAQAERDRSQTLAVLAGVVTVLPDSVFLLEFQLSPDSTIRLIGSASRADGVVAALQSVSWLADVQLESPAIREPTGPAGVELDRFILSAQIEEPL